MKVYVVRKSDALIRFEGSIPSLPTKIFPKERCNKMEHQISEFHYGKSIRIANSCDNDEYFDLSPITVDSDTVPTAIHVEFHSSESKEYDHVFEITFSGLFDRLMDNCELLESYYIP
jgi:hypothetical protein